MKIDAHQHFWKYNATTHDWIGDDMASIRRDFMPADLAPVLKENGIDGCIAVQADQTEAETEFLLELADAHSFIKGVVGWIDLQAPEISGKLQQWCAHPKFKGVRHILQGEQQRDLMLKPSFLHGIGQLAALGITYDILIFPDQLQFIPEFVSRFPDVNFVIDHIAKPDIKRGQIGEWKRELELVALYDNVSCKISGMVTEADLKLWKPADFKPYLDVVVDTFGMNRIMYGSDWPVCLAAGNYTRVLDVVQSYFSTFSIHEQDLFFGQNAIRFYGL